ncbi:protein CYCLOPS-like [Mercurialis annua]|uniref:protein CYCLOPS-like n=1 Tax=Mercurialis annua TaxID=3986 RepID=UPI002160DC5A|nr:protein CYCLOPS-like [Mercurialis annua]
MGEGNGYSENWFRNTSEEMFVKSLMEAPTMEILGLKGIHCLHQHNTFRTDSEELFKSWLTNGENPSSSIAHRTRQASRRISTELANLSHHQPGGSLQNKRSNDVLSAQNNHAPLDASTDFNQQPIRNAVEQNMQASNLYLAKAWSQPMTRSRSSELRKRYAASNSFKQDFADANVSSDPHPHDIANQFMSASNSSSSNLNTPQMGDIDKVSSVVSMLKGTLERKKLSSQIEKQTAQEIVMDTSFHQNIHEIPLSFQERSNGQVLQTVEEAIDLELEGFVNPINPVHLSTVSREPSQSESSTAAPVVSSGFDTCDGLSNSSQYVESSSQHFGKKVTSPENDPKAKDFRGRIIENLKDDRKRGGLVRHGSITSAASVDTTKKRRVERSRKMAEAKERNLTPPIPSDMQSIMKRCENLEKEVRSLKLNLSFMNRKDSEQTKQIEELQKSNEELADEKERLVEEIERILS